jgi:site-specific DNA recombinase
LPDHLSPMMRRPVCGWAIIIKDHDAEGRRIYCSRMRESGSCTNGRAFYLDDIERRVLSGLERQLKDPRAIERFLKTYVEERKRLAAAEESKRQRKETRLGEVKQEFDRAYRFLAAPATTIYILANSRRSARKTGLRCVDLKLLKLLCR